MKRWDARPRTAWAHWSTDGGRDLLAGQVHIEVVLEDGERVASDLASPPGAPDRPPSDEELRTKLELCAGEEAETLAALPWESAARNLRARLAA